MCALVPAAAGQISPPEVVEGSGVELSAGGAEVSAGCSEDGGVVSVGVVSLGAGSWVGSCVGSCVAGGCVDGAVVAVSEGDGSTGAGALVDGSVDAEGAELDGCCAGCWAG